MRSAALPADTVRTFSVTPPACLIRRCALREKRTVTRRVLPAATVNLLRALVGRALVGGVRGGCHCRERRDSSQD